MGTKMDLGSYFFAIHFPLETNQDQDKRLYVQSKAR